MVVQILVDDDPQPCHNHGRIGSRAHAQLDLRAGGQPVHPRVDRDERGTAPHHIDDGMAPEAIAVRRQRLFAPHDQHFGAHPVRVVVGAFQAACVVDLGVVGSQHARASGGTRLIAGETRLRVAGIRRAEHLLRHLLAHDAARAPCAREHGHAFRTVVRLDIVYLLFDDRIGIVPSAALPFVVLAAIDGVSFHRVDDATRIVHIIFECEATYAQPSLRNRVVLIALHMVEAAVGIHVQLQPAARRMAAGRRPHRRANHRKTPFLVLPRLAEVVFELHAFSPLVSCSLSRGRCI